MINKKLIHFNNKTTFEEQNDAGNILETSIIFIKDSKEIWTHGNLYKSVNWSVLESTYTAVDLGLPSGLKWADRNIGASSAEDAGLYFEWGGTVGYTVDQVGTDKIFDWSTYFDTTDGGSTFTKYGIDKLTVLEASDDAATVNMGSDWRMPILTEIQELVDNTTLTFIDLDGNEFSQSDAEAGSISEGNLKGIRFTGTNDNSIFIPAAGMAYNDAVDQVNSNSLVWSSEVDTQETEMTAFLLFGANSGFCNAYTIYRYLGMSVRGVKS